MRLINVLSGWCLSFAQFFSHLFLAMMQKQKRTTTLVRLKTDRQSIRQTDRDTQIQSTRSIDNISLNFQFVCSYFGCCCFIFSTHFSMIKFIRRTAKYDGLLYDLDYVFSLLLFDKWRHKFSIQLCSFACARILFHSFHVARTHVSLVLVTYTHCNVSEIFIELIRDHAISMCFRSHQFHFGFEMHLICLLFLVFFCSRRSLACSRQFLLLLFIWHMQPLI